MADALDPAANIYQGTWTDWSKSNSAWGLTWTLCPDNAVLVTSALAVFVTLAGSQLWSITRFVVHQAGTRSPAASPSTPNHKKEQVILRNATTDLATARLMAYLAWKSRKRAGKMYPRTVSIAIFALLHAIVFMVAGTFSNLAISAGSPVEGSMVLSRSKHCGIWNETYLALTNGYTNADSNETLSLSVEFNAKVTHNVQLSLEYAQKCYLAEESFSYMSSICNTLKKPRLNWTTQLTGTCPFESSLCRTDATVMVMDTGKINSHDDLGINAKPSERLDYHRVTTCAVLNDTGRVTGWDGTILSSSSGAASNQSSNIAKAFYGPSFEKRTDWTYAYSNFAQFFDNFSTIATVPYQVVSMNAWAPSDPVWSLSDFEPIDEMSQGAADLILFFLSYTGTYATEIDDPWFSAHRRQSFDGSPALLETRFARDSAISTIGCTEHHQFCTTKGICTPSGGFDQVQNDANFNNALTPHQNATFDRILRAATQGSLRAVVNGLAVTSTPLLAISQIAVGSTVVSMGLPETQWQRELNYWHSISMAQLQRTIVQYATGQIAAQSEYLLPASEAQDKWFCDNLMIPSTVYQSFSILKMILILLFGAAVITISLNIEAIERSARKCLGKADSQTQWDHDDMLKLRVDMRESLWPPTLPSPAAPPPPPKSPRFQSVNLPRRLERSPEIHTTVRAVSRSLSDEDQEWKRSSSPTLPLEDRALSVLSRLDTHSDSRNFLEPGPMYRQDSDSWMAISLSDLDAPTQDFPLRDLGTNDATSQKPITESHNLPMMQRFRNPMQFHVPRPQGHWV